MTKDNNDFKRMERNFIVFVPIAPASVFLSLGTKKSTKSIFSIGLDNLLKNSLT